MQDKKAADSRHNDSSHRGTAFLLITCEDMHTKTGTQTLKHLVQGTDNKQINKYGRYLYITRIYENLTFNLDILMYKARIYAKLHSVVK